MSVFCLPIYIMALIIGISSYKRGLEEIHQSGKDVAVRTFFFTVIFLCLLIATAPFIVWYTYSLLF